MLLVLRKYNPTFSEIWSWTIFKSLHCYSSWLFYTYVKEEWRFIPTGIESCDASGKVCRQLNFYSHRSLEGIPVLLFVLNWSQYYELICKVFVRNVFYLRDIIYEHFVWFYVMYSFQSFVRSPTRSQLYCRL